MNHEITRDEEKRAQPFGSSVLVSQRAAIVFGIKQAGRRVDGDEGRGGARGADMEVQTGLVRALMRP